MNTKTMRLPPRRVLTPDKRKEPDRLIKPPSTAATFRPPPPAQYGSPRAADGAKAKAEPVGSNQLLAGYLAHEFLTKGTLFGEPWLGPARAQVAPVSASSAKPIDKAEPLESSEIASDLKRRRYEDVSRLVRADGTHLPGIVNPTQLARFLNL